MNDGPASLRFSRDKRGYENFYLVRSFRRRGRARTRILYWFRTPPNVKVGRKPFEEEVRRAIERQNPGVIFDWKKVIETPIPPPQADVERWREHRRLERAARLAGQPEAAAETDLDAAAELGPVAETEESAAATEEVAPDSEGDIALPEVLTVAPEGQTSSEIPADRPGASTPSRRGGRNRRGGRRHRRRGRGAVAAGPSEPLNSPSSADAGPSPKRDSEP
jgi:hypothetical protein